MSEEIYMTIIATSEGMREKFLVGWNHAASLIQNGETVHLTVGPGIEPVTLLQRRFFHGPVLRQISEQVEVPIFDAHGVDTGRRTRYVQATWKRYFKERFLGFKHTYEDKMVLDKKTGQWRPSKKKTPHKELISTETLGPAKYAKFIDKILDHCVVEFGVEFVFKVGEREMVKYEPKPRRGRTH